MGKDIGITNLYTKYCTCLNEAGFGENDIVHV